MNGTGRTVGGNTLRGAGIGALAGSAIFGLMMFSVGDTGWVNKEELAVIGLVFGGELVPLLAAWPDIWATGARGGTPSFREAP